MEKKKDRSLELYGMDKKDRAKFDLLDEISEKLSRIIELLEQKK